MPVHAERTERPNEQQAQAHAPAGLESARNAAYGPRTESQSNQPYAAPQYQQPTYDYSAPPADRTEMFHVRVEMIDLNLGPLFQSTFDTAIAREENAMIAAPICGPIFGAFDVARAARDAASTINDINQDLIGTYTSDDSARYSQKLYTDVEKIASGFQIISDAANHAWDVAQQHDNGTTNAGYANPETYMQIASDTGKFAIFLIAAADLE